MSNYRRLLILSVISMLVVVLLRPQTSAAQNDSPQLVQARAACASDVQRLCAGVPASGGRVLACLKQHKDEVSDGCKQAVLAAMGKSSGNASSASASTSAPNISTPAAVNPAATAASPSRLRLSATCRLVPSPRLRPARTCA